MNINCITCEKIRQEHKGIPDYKLGIGELYTHKTFYFEGSSYCEKHVPRPKKEVEEGCSCITGESCPKHAFISKLIAMMEDKKNRAEHFTGRTMTEYWMSVIENLK